MLATTFALAAAVGSAAGSPSEYEIKAAFLYNFTKFIDFPPGAFARADDPIKLCILGQNPFGLRLEASVKDKKIAGRGIVVLETKSLADAERCHVTFVSSSEKGRLDEVLQRLTRKPILTVSDIEHFAERGGAIGLTLQEQKVRFAVNLTTTRRQGLKVSSQLLKVAAQLIETAAEEP